MFNFGEQLPDTVDYARRWGDYYGEVDERAQRRWANRELRRGVDEENRYNLDRARSNQSAYANRAGLFESADDRFSNMGVRDVPNAAPTDATAGLTPEQIAGNAQFVAAMTNDQRNLGNVVRALSLTSEEMNGLFRHQGGSQLGFREYTVQEIQNNPSLRDVLQRGQEYGQLQIYEVQSQSGETTYRVRRRTQGIVSQQNFAVPEPNTFLGIPLTGEDARNMRGSPMIPLNPEYGRNRRRNNRDIENRSRTTNVRLPDDSVSSSDTGTSVTVPIPPAYDNTEGVASPEGSDELYRGPNTQTYPGGLEPPNATIMRSRDPDTSAALAPTPEMDMIEAAVQDQLRLANVAARHGRNAEAEQHFAQALQNQAAYLQQERLVMLRAGMQGHRSALADLLGLYSGRLPGTTQLQPTAENRNQFNLQYINSEGRWVNSPAGPFTLERLVGMAELLVDRESVMARSEANAGIITANIRAGADIQVARLRALTDQQRMFVDAAIAQMEAGSRERIAQGNAELVVDSTNNRAYLQWWEPGPNGQPMQIVREISEQDVRVADSNRRRTERQMVGRTVTGINNVTASRGN